MTLGTQASLKKEQQSLAPARPPLDGCWEPPSEHDVLLASSSKWTEATPRTITETVQIKYGGGVATADPGTIWVDQAARVLVGWHGTTQPPCGMDGEPMMELDE